MGPLSTSNVLAYIVSAYYMDKIYAGIELKDAPTALFEVTEQFEAGV